MTETPQDLYESPKALDGRATETPQDIVRSMRDSFPLPYRIGLATALVKTVSVPPISEVLKSAHGFDTPTQRLERTGRSLYDLFEYGCNSPEGEAALWRMNRAHARPGVTNDKLLYVLSLFVNEPIDAIDRFGPRKTTDLEHLATHEFWKEVGSRINIKEIPAYEQLIDYRTEYENAHLRYDPTNSQLAERILDALNPDKGILPAIKRIIMSYSAAALLDSKHRAALGYTNRTTVHYAFCTLYDL